MLLSVSAGVQETMISIGEKVKFETLLSQNASKLGLSWSSAGRGNKHKRLTIICHSVVAELQSLQGAVVFQQVPQLQGVLEAVQQVVG